MKKSSRSILESYGEITIVEVSIRDSLEKPGKPIKNSMVMRLGDSHNSVLSVIAVTEDLCVNELYRKVKELMITDIIFMDES